MRSYEEKKKNTIEIIYLCDQCCPCLDTLLGFQNLYTDTVA